MSQPLVSVIIPTYNGLSRGFLKEAVQSALTQTYGCFEIIIVNDGSKDGTLSFLHERYAADPRVRIVTQENRGLAGARNAGIREARGGYLAFLDDDDEWLPEKLARQVEFMERASQDTAMVYCAAQNMDVHGAESTVRYRPIKEDAYRDMLLNGNGVSCPASVMIRRMALDRIGIFDESLKSAEDLDLWIRIAKVFRIASMPDVLVRYRVHSNALTSGKMLDFCEHVIYFRLVQEDAGIAEEIVWRRLYERMALRHFSINDWRGARRYSQVASAFGPVSLQTHGIFWLSFLPWFATAIKKCRKSVLLKMQR